jgi:stress response protein YsnF
MLNAETAKKTLADAKDKKNKSEREKFAKEDLQSIEAGLQKAIETETNCVYIELSAERMSAIQPALEKLGFTVTDASNTGMPLAILFKHFISPTTIEIKKELKIYSIAF